VSPSGAAMVRPRPTYRRVAGFYDHMLRYSGLACGIERFLARQPIDLAPGAHALDAGCGTGFLALWLAARYPQATVTAFDLEPRMLAVVARNAARNGVPRSRLVIARGDLRAPERLERYPEGTPLPPPTAGYDLVIVGAALEHVPLAETVRRLATLLRPGGVFLNLGMRRSPVTSALTWLYHFRPYRPDELRGAAAAAGLTACRVEPLPVRDFPANLTRLAMVARKK
jgi:SAM-dependent methyltransferase